MEEKTQNRCYLVRTEYEFVSKGLAAIGWSRVDFTQHNNSQEIITAVSSNYKIGKWTNQIRRFVVMKKGDIVVVPLHRSVAIGFVADDTLLYSLDDKTKDRANQRKVDFIKDKNGKIAIIKRDDFTQGFQSRLRVPGIVVNDISEFKIQIEKAINDLNSGEIFSWAENAKKQEESLEKEFKKTLLENIKNGKTNLQAGGVGLENLVKELLIIEGYEAEVLSKRAFTSFADADIKASKSDRFSLTNVLIQVKHHRGTAGGWGIKQLEEIKNQSKTDYSDYKLVLVTSAFVDDKLREYAEQVGITVIDGKELIDWIFDCLDDLAEATKRKLGICEVPRIIPFL